MIFKLIEQIGKETNHQDIIFKWKALIIIIIIMEI